MSGCIATLNELKQSKESARALIGSRDNQSLQDNPSAQENSNPKNINKKRDLKADQKMNSYRVKTRLKSKDYTE